MAKETKKEKKDLKNKKHFFKDFKAELKKVIWPTPKQLVNNTTAVVVIVLLTAVIVFVLDFAFDSLNNYGLNPLKENIKNSVTVEETEGEEAQDEQSSEEKVEDTETDSENKTEESNKESEEK